MSKSKKTELERLKEIWYKKLKDTGFDDIELSEQYSNRRSTSRSNDWIDPLLRQATEDYYTMAYHFLHSYEFESEIEKVIWEYHAEGLSIRNIVKILKDVKVETNRIKVWKTVNRLTTIMKGLYLYT